MPDPTPTHLTACDESLPLLPITRQFDFGQFVFLRQPPQQSGGSGGAHGNVGSWEKARGQNVVIDPSGGTYQKIQDWMSRYQKIASQYPGRSASPWGPATDVLGGISLVKLLNKTNPLRDSAPVTIEVDSARLSDVISNQKVEHEGKTYEVDLGTSGRASLSAGQPVLAMARPEGGAADDWFVTEVTPNIDSRNLNASEMDEILARGEVSTHRGVERVEMNESVSGALLSGEPVVARLNGSGEPGRIVRLVPPATEQKPASTSIAVGDLSRFFAHPSVPAADGLSIPVELDASIVHELRTNGSATVVAAGMPVTLYAGKGQPEGNRPRVHEIAAPSVYTVAAHPESVVADGSGAGATATAAYAETVPTLDLTVATGDESSTDRSNVAVGLPVAVFMPWRQSWELTGFSRGELRHSLALAPQEETTIEVSSWERRLRTLDQSATTDIEQSFESLQTERETDDVFQELTKRHDFAWQIEGSVDATYSYGSAAVEVNVGGIVTDATQLQQIARDTQQRMKESTQKAAAKIRSVRTTHVTDSIETGRQERVTRHIRNPNFSHTLALDFFETLSHYKVTLEAVPDRLGLVALIPNPMATKEFDTDLIRRNETALRRALLDAALVDGFEACRKITAYKEAKDILEAQETAQKKADELKNKETSADTQKADATKQTPQEFELVEIISEIAGAAKKTSDDEDIDTALAAIKSGTEVSADARRKGQYWLFRRLCAKYLPSLLDAIDTIAGTMPTVGDAATLIAVVSPPGSATTLANLNDKTDAEKEQAGLGPKIKGINRLWGWSTGRCREEGLYTANDAGLAGMVDRFARAYEAWQAKRAEGEMAAAKDVAVVQASAQQDKLTAEDKLAMAFPLDELSSAYEREEALRSHLNGHVDHYSFALFQSLSPAEQNAYIEAASGGALEVGMFEPRVIAISGPKLAVPLSPPPAGPLHDLLDQLRESFRTAFANTADTPDTFIFPTPGLTITSRLGKCSACEEFIEESRKIELRRLAAEADSAEQEAARRAARIKAGDLADPDVESAPVHVTLDRPT